MSPLLWLIDWLPLTRSIDNLFMFFCRTNIAMRKPLTGTVPSRRRKVRLRIPIRWSLIRTLFFNCAPFIATVVIKSRDWFRRCGSTVTSLASAPPSGSSASTDTRRTAFLPPRYRLCGLTLKNCHSHLKYTYLTISLRFWQQIIVAFWWVPVGIVSFWRWYKPS
jgi:hypothetical protein